MMQENKPRGLALFDFDGTITTHDTMFKFLEYSRGSLFFWTRMVMLSPMFISYKLGIIPNYKAKEILLASFFKGMDYQWLLKKGEGFCKEKVPSWVKKSALEKLKEHQAEGSRVVLVSASVEVWLAGWCVEQGIEYLASRLEVVQGKVTGRLMGANCYGPEKENRIKGLLNLEEYAPVYAYGDSAGDKEMLALADHPHYRFFMD